MILRPTLKLLPPHTEPTSVTVAPPPELAVVVAEYEARRLDLALRQATQERREEMWAEQVHRQAAQLRQEKQSLDDECRQRRAELAEKERRLRQQARLLTQQQADLEARQADWELQLQRRAEVIKQADKTRRQRQQDQTRQAKQADLLFGKAQRELRQAMNAEQAARSRAQEIEQQQQRFADEKSLAQRELSALLHRIEARRAQLDLLQEQRDALQHALPARKSAYSTAADRQLATLAEREQACRRAELHLAGLLEKVEQQVDLVADQVQDLERSTEVVLHKHQQVDRLWKDTATLPLRRSADALQDRVTQAALAGQQQDARWRLRLEQARLQHQQLAFQRDQLKVQQELAAARQRLVLARRRQQPNPPFESLVVQCRQELDRERLRLARWQQELDAYRQKLDDERRSVLDDRQRLFDELAQAGVITETLGEKLLGLARNALASRRLQHAEELVGDLRQEQSRLLDQQTVLSNLIHHERDAVADGMRQQRKLQAQREALWQLRAQLHREKVDRAGERELLQAQLADLWRTVDHLCSEMVGADDQAASQAA